MLILPVNLLITAFQSNFYVAIAFILWRQSLHLFVPMISVSDEVFNSIHSSDDAIIIKIILCYFFVYSHELLSSLLALFSIRLNE